MQKRNFRKHKYLTIPSRVRTEESGDDGTMLARGLLGLGIGRGFRAGGARAGSIFQGETLSGRGMLDVSSHLTLRHLHLDLGHLLVSVSSIPTMVPVNLQINKPKQNKPLEEERKTSKQMQDYNLNREKYIIVLTIHTFAQEPLHPQTSS